MDEMINFIRLNDYTVSLVSSHKNRLKCLIKELYTCP